MMTVFHWDGAAKSARWLSAADLAGIKAVQVAAHDVWWIDLEEPTPEEEQLVLKQFLPVHVLTYEDIVKPSVYPHFPKVEEFPDYLLVITNPLREPKSDDSLATGPVGQLSAVLTHSVLVTHHRKPLECIRNLRAFLEKHTGSCDRGPDYLFHLVLDAMVDEYSPVLDRLIERLDLVEIEVFSQASPHMLAELLALKREVIGLRKTLIMEREVLVRLTRGEFALIDVREMAYYRNVYDHLVRYSELIEASREMVSDLMQTHLAAVSNKLNEIMKVLTMISTIVLPMTLVAGIYGMNFKGWFPELEWTYGYPFALGLMVCAGIGSFVFFKYRKWI